ncbi:NAD-dependent epimerase/dehydratase family protein [Clostridium tagluense]|uniref:NAD-dependent epimerase/dehydratase family protein n=1 Tax=Clostridium tagluense TaxID=360422 RepID=UPI001C6F5800|nr:NAD-dependent epimerase/dehydratase family protein [Clostridium tagluense]MBW9159376.1 NAD-dependent epimerase/dehydratase family protein [Clostridium tagluense]WLC63658.1 NAD-dependent epimerase/dehydratase family protein [Clostridium tagluense]
MKFLVMGGTEFVSSSLTKYLISKGYIVDIFTRGIKPLKYDGIRKHLKGDRKSIEDLKVNISNERYDYIFDTSAYEMKDMQKLIGILNKENLKRYVFCSSGSVYIPSDKMVTEEFTRGENANWGSYGLDKKKAEDYLLGLWKDEKFPITIFRPTYIYGQDNNLYRETYLFDRVTKGLDVPIPNGNQETQFVYISDLVKIFESAIYKDKTVGQAYNVTHPELVTWQQLVETTMKVVNRKVNIKKVDNRKINISAREYFPFRNVTYLLDTKKAEADGLYMPQIDLYQGLELAYKWYRKAKPELKDAKMNKIHLALEI